MAGYSTRSLVDKLGIKPGYKVYVGNAPEDYDQTLGDLPESTTVLDSPDEATDFIQFFTKRFDELERELPRLKKALAPSGMIWISWPKKASKVETDVDEGLVRKTGLKNGLVDIKICAVDEVWSGLKFVYRVKDRK
ncbi:DUF3052 domain-containing protein [bacterium]|nr:DUF3052 domain-containing protein [bacterium]